MSGHTAKRLQTSKKSQGTRTTGAQTAQATRSPRKSQGKRRRSKAPVIAVAVVLVLALAAGGYLALCGWVKGNGLLMPGTTVSGLPDGESVDLSKLDAESATALLSEHIEAKTESCSLTVIYGDQTALLEGTLLTTDAEAPVTQALTEKEETPFIRLGAAWLGAGTGSEQTVSALSLSEEGQERVERLSSQIADTLYVAPVDGSYEITEDEVVVTRGVDGQEVDQEALAQDITNALISGQSQLEVVPTSIPAVELTGEELSQQVYTEPQSPTRNADGTVTPTVVGRSLDASEAQSLIDATLPGEVCSIPLTLTQPDYGDESLLYQDLLSSSETYMNGPDNRRTNIKLAAAAVNGTIILPGETFSYNQTVGERTAAKGYKAATVYVGGLDKQELGGGICQLASAIYYCTLYANLDVVSRINHRFAVTYVPYGLDATVAWPTIDYKFRNDTSYPIKITATTDGSNNLYVKFYGTKTDDLRVEMKTKQLSQTASSTTYQVDSSLSSGQTKTLVSAYTGYKYESYRYVYDGNGNLVSSNLEASSTYSVRDKVVGVSPSDAAKYGLSGGETATPEPSESVEPSDSPAPSESVQPSATPEPTPTPTPEPTPEPVPETTAETTSEPETVLEEPAA